ncbi:MAG: hypothetical protein EBR81_10535, partial [Proteobacteria bacterium]|nr:hypothetical protein [Pseudomonadota bacterium]
MAMPRCSPSTSSDGTGDRHFLWTTAALLRPVVNAVVHKFLDCGNLERGFARIQCTACGLDALLAFSCKSRWFCPSCHQKNVLTSAEFLVARVLAPVHHRHYVLALPKMLRPYFQRHRVLLKHLKAR